MNTWLEVKIFAIFTEVLVKPVGTDQFSQEDQNWEVLKDWRQKTKTEVLEETTWIHRETEGDTKCSRGHLDKRTKKVKDQVRVY